MYRMGADPPAEALTKSCCKAICTAADRESLRVALSVRKMVSEMTAKNIQQCAVAMSVKWLP